MNRIPRKLAKDWDIITGMEPKAAIEKGKAELKAKYGRTQDLVPFIGQYKDTALIMRDYSLVIAISVQGESDALRPAEEVEAKRVGLGMMFARIMHDYQIFVGSRQQRFSEVKNDFNKYHQHWETALQEVDKIIRELQNYLETAWKTIREKAEGRVKTMNEYLQFAAEQVDTAELQELLQNISGANLAALYPGPGALIRTINDIMRPIFVARWGGQTPEIQSEIVQGITQKLNEGKSIITHYLDLIIEHAAYYEKELMLSGPPLRYLAIIIPERPLLPHRKKEVVPPSNEELEVLYTKLMQKARVIMEQLQAYFPKVGIMKSEELIAIYSDMYQHGMAWRANI